MGKSRLVALLSGALVAGVVLAAPANASGTLTGVPSFEGSGIQNPALVGADPVRPGHQIAGFDGIGVQSIIGPDNRVRVNPTTSFPARATVLITRVSGGVERQHCTGWMFGPSLVLTAGHCVYSGSAYYTGLRFYPGYNGDTAPYGSCTATQLRASAGYVANGSPDQDYGGANLNCTIGNTVGWYGAYATTASLNGTPTTIQGYGGDKNKQQWLSTDQIRTSGALRLYYENDTIGGNSGSAVATNRPAGSPGCSGWCSLAFHAYGGSQNSGARITAARLTEVTGWR
ncbi:glutamyl endopeptidase [Kibdelosporangium banguiense]|uniref:Serine protease n=1 Tax=Kibdelosporangium banguiense TaxID=1365924 RepID=A0ABS4TEL4_9PSEU|nr:trypsin-like serine protease [Kibdelosporangium banguiense]MBP2322434.1 glutamyl endopeptidase [Kibdelosporangium banguiense]